MRVFYSKEDKDYIIYSQNNKYLAKRFNTTLKNIMQLRSIWKAQIKKRKGTYNKKIFKFKKQKRASSDYEVAPADEI